MGDDIIVLQRTEIGLQNGGDVQARMVNVRIEAGEFVAVIGKRQRNDHSVQYVLPPGYFLPQPDISHRECASQHVRIM